MDFWQRYRAIDARDTRFDGQFYTAVRTTGIYCRPSCPARTPKAANVTFYETSAAAHDAGLPGLQALPAGGRARHAGLERPLGRRRPRHAADQRRRHQPRRRRGPRRPAGLLLPPAQPDPQPRTRCRSAVPGPGQPRADRTHPAGLHRNEGLGHRLRRRIQQRAAVQRDDRRSLRHDALRAAGHRPAPRARRGARR